MPYLPFDVVAFDLDGTLADTAPDLAAALNQSLRGIGRPEIGTAAVRRLIGHGARALLRKGLAATGDASEELVERLFPVFIEYYAANICVGSRAFEGVDKALEALSGTGASLALCTNKPERLTYLLLDALGWRGRFASVVGGDTLAVKKPDPAPLREAIARAGGGKAAFVGDSIIDADTAKAAGVPFIAVRFGFADRPVEELGADALIGGYGELIATLHQL